MISAIASIGLEDAMDYFKALPDIAEQAAVYAVNDVSTREALPSIRRQMRVEIDFPAGYLEGDRLTVSRKARKGDIQSILTGRDRPTSLARFAQGQTPETTRGRGVTVQVKPGVSKFLGKKSFMVRLRNGNLGVAVQLAPGETLAKSDKAYPLRDNVYLLYGPSVEQVFQGVAAEESGKISASVSKQFFRQFNRLLSGKR